MKKSFSPIIPICISVTIVAVVVACIFAFGNVPQKEEINDTPFKTQFVNACVGPNASYAYCECGYEMLKKDMGLDGLIAMSLEYDKTGVLPKSAITSVMKCFK